MARINVPLGFALAEVSSPGLNLSDALSSFRLFTPPGGRERGATRTNQRGLADFNAAARVGSPLGFITRATFSAVQLAGGPFGFRPQLVNQLLLTGFSLSTALDANVFDGFASVGLITTLQQWQDRNSPALQARKNERRHYMTIDVRGKKTERNTTNSKKHDLTPKREPMLNRRDLTERELIQIVGGDGDPIDPSGGDHSGQQHNEHHLRLKEAGRDRKDSQKRKPKLKRERKPSKQHLTERELSQVVGGVADPSPGDPSHWPTAQRASLKMEKSGTGPNRFKEA